MNKASLTVNKASLTVVLAAIASLALGSAAIAAVASEFGNYCAMGLVKGDKKITDCSISSKIEGKTYCFGSTSAEEEFMEDPAGHIAKAQ
ncbi:MAG: hypothetical protein ACREDO_07580, partial [Methyloceanibacter sp.]